MRYVLGDVGDDVYTAWAKMVQSNGGAPVTLPGDAIAIDTSSSTSVYQSFINAQALPAARYTVAQAQKLGLTTYDYTSSDGAFVYITAPDNVVQFVADNGVIVGGVAASAPAIAKGALSIVPDWLKQLQTGSQILVGVAVIGGGLYILSFLPRGNPPRRRRR